MKGEDQIKQVMQIETSGQPCNGISISQSGGDYSKVMEQVGTSPGGPFPVAFALNLFIFLPVVLYPPSTQLEASDLAPASP